MAASSLAAWVPPLVPRTPADVYALALFSMQTFLALGVVTIAVPAPHGKWAPQGSSGVFGKVKINANLGWFLMEIWGPVFLVLSMASSGVLSTSGKLSLPTVFPAPSLRNLLALPTPNKLLGAFYVVHYANRAVIQPLRTPKRSPMSIVVVLSAFTFQSLNGFLLGNWLAGRAPAFIVAPSLAAPVKQAKGVFSLFARTSSGNSAAAAAAKTIKHTAAAAVAGGVSPSVLLARPGLLPEATLRSPLFWLGILAAAAGLASNIYHDEILMRLRARPAKLGSKAAAALVNGAASSTSSGGTAADAADAAAPARNTRSAAHAGNGHAPEIQLADDGKSVVKQGEEDESVQVGASTYRIPRGGLFEYVDHPHYLSEWIEWAGWALASLVFLPAFVPGAFAPTTPALAASLRWYANAGLLLLRIPTSLFPLTELATMGPRAVKGHQWYLKTFGAKYPANRKAVIPGLL